MNYRNTLLNKINTKKATVGIIGLGYVGLPLAGVFAKKNFNVIGFDIDSRKVQMLNKGKSYIKHIDFCFFVAATFSGKYVSAVFFPEK